jgi:hemerythrin-like domain-containing protein
MSAPAKRPTDSLRAEHVRLLNTLHALGQRIEKLYESGTMDQLALAREVIDFVQRQVIPHARAEEYTLYPAADWAGGEGSRMTEVPRYEHGLIVRRCQALEKAISAGSPAGKLMHLCYGTLGLIASHFQATEEVILPYLDRAFDAARFEKEVLTPLRVERSAKR